MEETAVPAADVQSSRDKISILAAESAAAACAGEILQLLTKPGGRRGGGVGGAFGGVQNQKRVLDER